MIFSLSEAQGTIDLPAANGVFSLDSPLPSSITNYLEQVILVNQNGDTLVNQNGDTLVANVLRSARVNVITLGE